MTDRELCALAGAGPDDGVWHDDGVLAVLVVLTVVLHMMTDGVCCDDDVGWCQQVDIKAAHLQGCLDFQSTS